MSSFIIKENTLIAKSQLLSLYKDAGWLAYTNEPNKLVEAIKNSLYVLTAWDDDKLVGLIRVVGDGLTIVYIQDILILKKYKRQGIGTLLMKKVIEKFQDVRQKVLLTEDSEETRGFYESMGFESCDKGESVAFFKSY
jgi:ribosomal protein S18 acetylase RimI-like enzyme